MHYEKQKLVLRKKNSLVESTLSV